MLLADWLPYTMFVLMKLKDTVRVIPQHLGSEESEVVRDLLMGKYCNRVISGQGLCVCVYDFNIIDNCLYHGDGGAHVRVEFRLVMFRPSPGEILVGRIQQCDASGLYVSLGFFGHILIPACNMQGNSHYDEKEGVWVWKFEDNDLFMDLDQPVRLRVEKVEFADACPKEVKVDLLEDAKTSIATAEGINQALANADNEKKDDDDSEEKDAKVVIPEGTTIAAYRPPLLVFGSIKEDGLGLLDWWA